MAAALGLLSAGSALAQTVSSYTFSQSAGTYTAITGGTLVQTLTPSQLDDNNFGGLPIGFSFGYAGQTYRAFNVNANGWLSLGDVTQSGGNYTALTTINNSIAAFNRDLQMFDVTTGGIRYQTTGSAGSRVLTVQWANFKKFGTNGTGDDLNFQIKLYEGTNNIDLVYGAFTINGNATTTQVGLRGAAGTDFNTRTGTDLDLTTAGGANSAVVTSTTAAIPTSGLTLTFTNPGTACVIPTIRAIAPGITNATITGFTASGTLNYEYRTTVGPGAWIPTGATIPTGDLTANTSYDVRAYSDCGVTPLFYTPIKTFRTLCTAQTATITEDFQTTTGSNLPNCWTGIVGLSTNGSVGTTTSTLFSPPATGNRALQIFSSSTYNELNRQIAVLPLVSDLGGNNLQLRFQARADVAGAAIQVGTVNNVGQNAVFTPLPGYGPTPLSTTVTTLLYTLNNVSGQFLAIKPAVETGGSSVIFLLDNFFYEPGPVCGAPNAPTATATSFSAATITFAANPTNTGGVTLYYGDATYAPTAGSPTGTGYIGTITGASSPFNLTGLTGNTTYRIYARGNCGPGSDSDFSLVTTFTTPQAPPSVNVIRTENAGFTSIASTGTSISSWRNGTSTDENLSSTIPLPFPVQFLGTTFSTTNGFAVSTNGFLTFNTATASTGSAFNANGYNFESGRLAGTVTPQAIQTAAPFYDDLQAATLTGETPLQVLERVHHYQVTGTSPSRVLTIEWTNTARFVNTGVSLTFQVKVYENATNTNNKIEFWYGTMTAYNGTTTAPTYQYALGLAGANPTQTVIQQVENTNYFQNLAKLLNITPSCDTKYEFFQGTANTSTPPTAATAPTNDLICNAANLTVNPVSAPATQFCTYYSSRLATPSTGLPACGSSNADDDVWFVVTPTNPTGTNLQIRVGASNGYVPTLQIFTSSNNTCTGTLTQVGTCATGTSGQAITQSINPAPAGTTYFIRVNSSGTGSGTYGQFVIDAFGLPVPPANDNCAAATTASAYFLGTTTTTCTTTAGTTFAATSSAITTTCGGTPTNDVFYIFTAGSNGAAVTVQGGTGMAPSVEVLSNTCSTPTSLGCATATAGGTATVTVGVTLGTSYKVRVYGGTGSFSICATSVTFLANDNPSGAGAGTPFDLTPGTTCTTTGATPSAANGSLFTAQGPSSEAPAAPGFSDANDDVFYSFVAGTIPVTVSASAPNIDGFNVDLVLAVYSGTPGSLTLVSSADATFSGGTETLNLTGLTNGQRYYIRLYDYYNDVPTAAFTFTVCVQAFPSPANDNPGGAIGLTAAASCSAPTAGTTQGATNTTGTGLNPAPKFNGGTIASANDVFYTFTNATAATRSITVEPTGANSTTFDPVIQVLTESGGVYTSVAFVDDINPGAAETLTLTNLPAGTYFVRVYNTQDFGTTEGGFSICLTQGAKFVQTQPNLIQGGTAPVFTPTTTVGAGTNGNLIGVTEVIIGGATGTLPFTSATFRYNGTNVNDIKPLGVRLYQSADLTFTPGTDPQVGGTRSFNATGDVTFTNISTNLPIGTTYFYITYDVAATATPGNVIDVQLQPNSFVIGGNTYPTALDNPAGSRTITAAPPAFDNICNAVPMAVPAPNAPVVYTQYSNANATANGPAPSCQTSYGGDVWFRVSVPTSRNLYVDVIAPTTGSTPALSDAIVDVFRSSNGFCSGTLTSLGCNDDGGQGNYSTVAVTAIPAGVNSVFIRVSGFGTNQGFFRIAVADRPKFTGGTSTAFDLTVFNNFFPQTDAPTTFFGANTIHVPAGLTNNPVVSTNQSVFGVYVGTGATLNLTGTAMLTVGNGGFTSTGTVNQSDNSQIYVNGTVNVPVQAMMYKNLRIGAQGGTLAGNVDISRVLRLQGTLTTNGRRLRLLSNAAGTALIHADGGSVAGAYTAQRYIDPSFSTAPRVYRHLSAPVTTNFADLNTDSPRYRAITNTAYNADPTATPFPTIYGYDEARINTTRPNFTDGYFSPNSPGSPMGGPGEEMMGYSALMADGVNPDFVGTTHTGPYSISGLGNSGAANSGWHLLGNPYPSPIDWSTVTNAQIGAMNGTIYIARSVDIQNGNYLSFQNGVGSPSAKYVAMAQGFFMFKPATPAGTTTVSLSNANRVTTIIAGSNDHYRSAGAPVAAASTETRPLVKLTVNQNGLPVEHGDETYVYFQAGATTGMDQYFDGYKLHSTGTAPSLYTKVGMDDATINGLPELTTAEVIVPLGLKVGVLGSYELNAAQLLNIPAATPVVLRDAVTGTEHDLRANPTYAFTMTSNYSGNRFELVFNPANRVTGVSAALAASQIAVFPNPVASNSTLQVRMTALTNVKSVTARLVDALGRTVATEQLAVVNGEVDGAMSTRSLSKGVYTLRLTAGAQNATRRVVIE